MNPAITQDFVWGLFGCSCAQTYFHQPPIQAARTLFGLRADTRIAVTMFQMLHLVGSGLFATRNLITEGTPTSAQPAEHGSCVSIASEDSVLGSSPPTQ